MAKERIPNWFYNDVSSMTLAVIKEIVSDAIIEERKRLADKIRNLGIGDGYLRQELANAIESEDS